MGINSKESEQETRRTTESMVFKIGFPILIAISAYLVVDKLNSIDKRLSSLEGIFKEQVELKYKLENLQKNFDNLHGNQPNEPVNKPTTMLMHNYFVKPSELILNKKRYTL